jgi:hypothetical protein
MRRERPLAAVWPALRVNSGRRCAPGFSPAWQAPPASGQCSPPGRPGRCCRACCRRWREFCRGAGVGPAVRERQDPQRLRRGPLRRAFGVAGPVPRPGPSAVTGPYAATAVGGDPPGVRDFGLPGGLRQDGRTAGGHAPGPGRCLHAPEKNTKSVRLSGSKNLSPEQRKRKKMEDSFPQSFQLCRIGKIWDENCVGFVF